MNRCVLFVLAVVTVLSAACAVNKWDAAPNDLRVHCEDGNSCPEGFACGGGPHSVGVPPGFCEDVGNVLDFGSRAHGGEMYVCRGASTPDAARPCRRIVPETKESP